MSDTDKPAAESQGENQAERIAKRIARSGVCSRRDAERMIAERRVKLNGKVLDTPAVTVTDDDIILVDEKPLPEKERPRLWRLFKKRGLVTSHRDEQGRETVFDHLPSYIPRVISVGRLDLNSEGLLLLTNDGELARYLELPSTGWARRYRVRVHGFIDEAKLKALENGVTVDGVNYGPIQAEIDVQKGTNAWMTITLREGKNREIRRVMEHLGWPVTRLMRLSYGPFHLGNLAPGDAEEVTGKVMKEQLAPFFKGDYSRVSDGGNGDKSGTARARPKRPAPNRKPRAGAASNFDDKRKDDARPGTRDDNGAKRRPANRGEPAYGRGRDGFEGDAPENGRPTHKGRGRYAPGGRTEGKPFGKSGGKPTDDRGRGRRSGPPNTTEDNKASSSRPAGRGGNGPRPTGGGGRGRGNKGKGNN